MPRIFVFCSAENNLPEAYRRDARETGKLIGIRGHDFGYGGSNSGLMYDAAREAEACGAKLTGILPKMWKHFEKTEHRRLLSKDLRHRKLLYQMNADAFIALPGGFGTLDELFDTVVCRQHHIHQKPFAIVNTANFYGPLIKQIEHAYKEGFIDQKNKVKYKFVRTPLEAMNYIEKHLAKFKQD